MTSRQITIADKLNQRNSTGFDYLRIILAASVILIHSFQMVAGVGVQDDIANSHFHFLVNSVLPAFFALSGFLVAGSLERNNLVTFAGLRILRIVPALGVEILLSALIIGPIFTSLPLSDYFAAKEFWVYFANILGIIHLQLPGVFLTNPYPNVVNVSLWTIPFELECYLTLAALAVVFRRSRVFLLVIPAVVAVFVTVTGVAQHGIHYFYVPGEEHHLGGRALVICFLCGVNIYAWRDKLPYSDVLGISCLIAGFALVSFFRLQYIAIMPLAYATVWIGLKQIPRTWVINHGDYSYGVYLFAGPIQQMLASFAVLHFWWVNFLGALIASVCYAAFSWHFVEYPIMRRKPQLTAITDRWARFLSDRLPKWPSKKPEEEAAT